MEKNTQNSKTMNVTTYFFIIIFAIAVILDAILVIDTISSVSNKKNKGLKSVTYTSKVKKPINLKDINVNEEDITMTDEDFSQVINTLYTSGFIADSNLEEVKDKTVINIDFESKINITLDSGKGTSFSNLYQDSQVRVIKERLSEVEKDKQISLDEYTTFRFSTEIKNDLLIFRLSEIGVLCPFIYERALSLDHLIDKNQVFKQCNDLKEVEGHILRLFKDGKICLINDKNEVSAIQINAFDISMQTIITIELKKVMTTHKDEVLNELYETEKKGLKIFKDLEKEMKRLGLNDALQEFQRIKKKYEK